MRRNEKPMSPTTLAIISAILWMLIVTMAYAFVA